jgi:chromosome partitioning protein
MTAIIALAQRKGGAGKTTLAAHLAVGWAQAGRRVAVLDIDPQGSLSRWAELRRAVSVASDAAIDIEALSGWKLGIVLARLRGARDLVILDTPPHAESDARAAIRAADLVVIPVQPSPMDLWATEATLEAARAEKRPVLLVLNRVAPRARLTQDIAIALADTGARLACARLGNRTAFAASIAAGLGVAEYEPGGAAAEELRALRTEIETTLGSAARIR